MECSLDPELYQRHRLTAEEREQFRTDVSNHALLRWWVQTLTAG